MVTKNVTNEGTCLEIMGRTSGRQRYGIEVVSQQIEL